MGNLLQAHRRTCQKAGGWERRLSCGQSEIRGVYGFTRRVFVLCMHSVGMRGLQGSRTWFQCCSMSYSRNAFPVAWDCECFGAARRSRAWCCFKFGEPCQVPACGKHQRRPHRAWEKDSLEDHALSQSRKRDNISKRLPGRIHVIFHGAI